MDTYTWKYETAMEFDLEDVKDCCGDFIKDTVISTDNYLAILDFASVSNDERILRKVISFISRNLQNLLCSHELLEMMTSKALLTLVREDKHGLFTNMTLIKFIVNWVETIAKERSPFLAELIGAVNLLCFELDDLDAIANMPLIRQNQSCREIIAEAKGCLTALETEPYEEDDAYLFTMTDKDVEFYGIKNQSVITIKGVLKIPSRIHEKRDAIGAGSLVLPIADGMLFICDRMDARCHIFNISRSFWKTSVSLPGGVSFQRYQNRIIAVSYFEGEVYVFGGKVGYHYSPTEGSRVDIYNISQDEWRVGTPVPCETVPSEHYSAALPNAGIFVLALSDNSCVFLSLYNAVDKRWETKRKPNLTARDVLCLLPFESNLYLFSSYTEGSYSYRHMYTYAARNVSKFPLQVDRYDPTSDQWTTTIPEYSLKSLLIVAGFTHNATIYLLGQYAENDSAAYSERKCALFKFDTVTGCIGLVRDIMPAHTVDFNRHSSAIVNIPKSSIARLEERKEDFQ